MDVGKPSSSVDGLFTRETNITGDAHERNRDLDRSIIKCFLELPTMFI